MFRLRATLLVPLTLLSFATHGYANIILSATLTRVGCVRRQRNHERRWPSPPWRDTRAD
jgi:hypothetical protein